MSWHLDVCGTKEEVVASIDEAMSSSIGMPASVGAYLKDAVAACKTGDGEYNVHVTSSGHRPMEHGMANETCSVVLRRAKTWKQVRKEA